MHIRQLSAAVGLVAALGLVLTACGDDRPTAAGPAASAVAPQSTATATVTTTATATATAGGTSGGSGPRKCVAADLRAAVAPGSGAQGVGSQGTQEVELTNRSSAACTMKGFPGVDLVGGQGTWSLVRAADQAQQVTLPPGGRAYVVITYLPHDPAAGNTGFPVSKIVITPPDDTAQLTVTGWTGAAPERQDAATHPGTYVHPVTASR